MIRFRKPLALLATGALAAAVPGGANAASCRSSIPADDRRAALADMTMPSEATPSDASGKTMRYDWIARGRINLGNAPGRFREVLPWASVFGVPGNRIADAAIDVRNVRLLVLSRKTGAWIPVVSTQRVWGQKFDKVVEANIVHGALPIEGSGTGATIEVNDRYMSHFWPQDGRTPIDPQDVAGIFASMDARIDEADHAAGARYVMNVGVDYWLDAKADWDNFRTNGGAGVGRLKSLTPQWRTYYMTTAGPAELARCIAPSR